MINFDMLSMYITFGLLFVFWSLMIMQGKELFRQIQGVSRRTWVMLGIFVAGLVLVVQPFVVHSIIFPNNHGFETMTFFRDSSVRTLRFIYSYIYGNVPFAMLGLVHELFCKVVPVFCINYFFSVCSVVLLFILVYLVFRNERMALFAAFLLGILPVHLRIAATESMFITVELYLLLTLVLFQMFRLSKDDRFAYLGIFSFFLLLDTRIEMYIIAPIVCAAFFLVCCPDLLVKLLKDLRAWGVSLGLTLCMLPRIMEIVPQITQNKMYGQVGQQSLFHHQAWHAMFNVFFDPYYTPVAFTLLFLFGALLMFRKDPRWSLFLMIAWIVPTFIYSKYYITPACYFRRTIPFHFALITFVAYGMEEVRRILLSRTGRHYVFYGLMLLVLLGGTFTHGWFLRKEYTMHQEYTLMEKVRRELNGPCVLVCLLEEDGPAGNRLNRTYQRTFLGGEDREIIGIRSFLKSPQKYLSRKVYYYKGAPCYKVPLFASGPRCSVTSSYQDALCSLLEKKFRLRTVQERIITRGDISIDHDELCRGQVTVGLYTIVGPRRGKK